MNLGRGTYRFLRDILIALIAGAVIELSRLGLLRVLPDTQSPLLIGSLAGSMVVFGAMYLVGILVTSRLRGKVVSPDEIRLLTGISATYTSLEAASEDLAREVGTAKEVSVLLHIGRNEFFDRHGFLLKALRSRVGGGDRPVAVRILHISKTAPALSEERAATLGKNRADWIRNVEYVRSVLRDLRMELPMVEVREHSEPYIWRLFMLEHVIFVSGYMFDTKNDHRAPVYRIEKGGERSLYPVFAKHFEYLWTSNIENHVV